MVALVLLSGVAQGCGRNNKAPQKNPRSYLEHYWDHTDPAALSADVREQRLVDYLYLAMNAAPAQRHRCWQTIARVFPNEQPNRLVADYFGDSDSPLYAPAMLEEYLAAIADLFEEGSAQRLRVDYLLGEIRKNKAGQPIADLDLVRVADRRRITLHALIAGSSTDSKVLFYDPACEECTALISRLAADPEPGPVVAVSVTGETRPLPPAWHSCTAVDPDQLGERFYLPRLPQLYTVGSDHIIRKPYPDREGVRRKGSI